jgi:hypothetical protein
MDLGHILGATIAALQGKYLAVELNKPDKKTFVRDLV